MDEAQGMVLGFRAGLAEYIEQRKPVAVTRHGVTVGVFVPTPRPSPGDVQALRDASAQLQAAMSMSEEDVNAAVAGFRRLAQGRAPEEDAGPEPCHAQLNGNDRPHPGHRRERAAARRARPQGERSGSAILCACELSATPEFLVPN